MAADPAVRDGVETRIADLEREVAVLRTALENAQRDTRRMEEDFLAVHEQHQSELVRRAATAGGEQDRIALASAEAIIAAMGSVQEVARHGEARLRTLLRSATDYAIIETDFDGRITFWNSGAREILGWEESEILGRDIAELFTPEDQAAGEPQAEIARARAEGRVDSERWHVRKDGTRFRGLERVMLLEGRGLLKLLRDRSRSWEIEQAWHSSEERMRLILESATEYAIFTIDSAGIVTSWNTGARRLLGYEDDEIIGKDSRIIFTPEDRAKGAADCEIETALAEGRAINERWHMRKDGSRFWGSGLMMPLKEAGAPGLLKIMRDHTGRRQADEMNQLLIGELNHRVKNTLATVQSLADQTAKNSGSLETFTTAFRSRLLAIAKAHDILTREAWEGAAIADIARAVLEAWIEDGRITVAGPEIRVSPKHALSLSMALNELATNAMKYGALSVADGHVDLAWTGGSECSLSWIERGGPPVSPPSRQGFGLRVLGRALATEFGRPVELRFERAGVECTIHLEPETGNAQPELPLME